MAKFTSPVPLTLKDLGLDVLDGRVLGTATTYRIPDAYVPEFIAAMVPKIPGGVTWITQDETSAVAGFDPTAKYDKTGGTITGAVTATGAISGASLSAAGAIAGASVSATGSITAATLSATGGILGVSATVSSARFKGAPWFDVRAYGAVGDGSTDDTTAIQAAVTAAQAVAGTVFFPVGNYKIISTVTASAPVSYRGSGGWTQGSIITMATSHTTALDFTSGADQSFVSGLRIIGAGGATAGNGLNLAKTVHLEDIWVSAFFNGVDVSASGSFYTEFNRVFAQNNANAGIKLETGLYNLTLLHCRLTGNATGLTGVSYTSLRMVGGSVEQNTTRGLELNGTISRTTVIEGVYFESAVGTEDIRLAAATTLTQALILNCHFADNAVASYWHINSFGVAGLTIMGSLVGTTGASGGSLQVAATGQDVLLINNTLNGTVTLPSTIRLTQIGANAFTDQLSYRGTRVASPFAAQTLIAGTAIVANAEYLRISAASGITSTAAPGIADGRDGQVVTIVNVGANAITLQDQGTLASSNLRLSAAQIALGTRDSLQLMYSSDVGDWVQIGQTNVL